VPDPALTEKDGAVLIPIRVQPRARKDAIEGVDGQGSVKVKLTAPPVDGAANEALLRFLGREVLGVAPSSLAIVRGETSREKVVAVHGLDLATVRARLA
jgi:uncharacterized protein (TIGR00251 family)